MSSAPPFPKRARDLDTSDEYFQETDDCSPRSKRPRNSAFYPARASASSEGQASPDQTPSPTKTSKKSKLDPNADFPRFLPPSPKLPLDAEEEAQLKPSPSNGSEKRVKNLYDIGMGGLKSLSLAAQDLTTSSTYHERIAGIHEPRWYC